MEKIDKSTLSKEQLLLCIIWEEMCYHKLPEGIGEIKWYSNGDETLKLLEIYLRENGFIDEWGHFNIER